MGRAASSSHIGGGLGLAGGRLRCERAAIPVLGETTHRPPERVRQKLMLLSRTAIHHWHVVLVRVEMQTVN